jgi:uncharacterized phiE125 gp8 family phage protein
MSDKMKPLQNALENLVLNTAKAAYPLEVAELKKQLEIADDDTTHDEQLEKTIKAVTEQFEHDTGLKLTNETWTYTLDRFGGDYIIIPIRPIQSITWIKYYDSANAQQTLPTSIYALDGATGTVPAGNSRILLKYNQDWPTTTDRYDAVEIKFVTGYGAAATAVPQSLKQALLLLAVFYFEHRGEPITEALAGYPAYEHLVRRFIRQSYP